MRVECELDIRDIWESDECEQIVRAILDTRDTDENGGQGLTVQVVARGDWTDGASAGDVWIHTFAVGGGVGIYVPLERLFDDLLNDESHWDIWEDVNGDTTGDLVKIRERLTNIVAQLDECLMRRRA